MIAGVVLQNLAYLVGAIVVATVLGLVVTFRGRRPKSVEANVESFHRGLQALAPDAAPAPRAGSAVPTRTRAGRVRTVVPGSGTEHSSSPEDRAPAGSTPERSGFGSGLPESRIPDFRVPNFRIPEVRASEVGSGETSDPDGFAAGKPASRQPGRGSNGGGRPGRPAGKEIEAG